MGKLNLRTVSTGAGAIAALVPGLGSATVIVNTVNSGFTENFSTSIAGDELSISNSYVQGPYDAYYYNDYYGTSGYDPSYYGYATSLVGSGLSLTTGGFIQPGTTIGGSNSFSSGAVALQSLYNAYDQDGYYSIPYSCGYKDEYTCYDYYYYQSVYYGGPSYSGSLLSSGAQTGYVGLALNVGGQTDYGWAELAVDGSGGTDLNLNLIADAFETTPGQAIVAGATQDPVAVTEPGTLSLLAAGAVGLCLLRRRRLSVV